MAKAKKGGKAGKQEGRKGKAPRRAGEVRLSEHPRARQQIRLAKSWAGLVGFALAGWAAWHGGATFFDAAVRALAWGVAAYVVVWACAVQVWRHLAVAEVRAVERRLIEARLAESELAREAEESRRAKVAGR